MNINGRWTIGLILDSSTGFVRTVKVNFSLFFLTPGKFKELRIFCQIYMIPLCNLKTQKNLLLKIRYDTLLKFTYQSNELLIGPINGYE